MRDEGSARREKIRSIVVGLAHTETTIFSSGRRGRDFFLKKAVPPHKLNTPINPNLKNAQKDETRHIL